MNIVSVREQPECARKAIKYFQKNWANETNKMIYEDCILNSIDSDSLLPQWYLLYDNERIIGCAGLVKTLQSAVSEV